MKKVLLLCLVLSFTKPASAQNDYSAMLDKNEFVVLLGNFNTMFGNDVEEAGAFFEQMSQREKFIKEKSLWDAFFTKTYDGNFMSQVNVEKIAKTINKDYFLQFLSWYGEKEVLNRTAYILSGDGMDEAAIASYLKPILKDEVQVAYVAFLYMNSYSQEMTREPFILKIDYEKKLNEKLKSAKTVTEKATAYKDIARLSYLMGADVKKTLAWAETSKNLKGDKEIYLLLASIYTELGTKKE